jgi:hypothetical protein
LIEVKASEVGSAMGSKLRMLEINIIVGDCGFKCSGQGRALRTQPHHRLHHHRRRHTESTDSCRGRTP